MNLLPRFLVSLPLLLLPAFAGDIVGQINFVNGDRLSGEPGQINDQGHLIWKAPNLLHQPGAVRLETVLDLHLEGGDIPANDANHDAVITLTNGDLVRGQLSGLNDDHVTLDTWYGGTLRIRRSMSNSIKIVRSERAVYNGPDAIENWSASGSENAWTVKNGQLVSHAPGSIARKIEFPKKCQISFDLAWRNNLKFRLFLFSDEGNSSDPENCYDMVCQRRFVYLRKRWKSAQQIVANKTIGQPVNIPDLATKEKVHMDFYIDRKVGTIALYVDGTQAQVWTDENPDAGGLGNWLHFISEDAPLHISQLRATPWKGDLPETADSEEPENQVDEKGQIIHLQNGDHVIGEVGAIEKGVLAIKTKYADILIPVERMRTVNLTSEDSPNYETPKLMNGDVRAWLHEGGRITFQLKSFDGNSLTGYSQTFGESKFDLNAFSRLEFNIHEEDLKARRSAPNW